MDIGVDVTLNPDGSTATGSGLQLALFNAEKSRNPPPQLYVVGQVTSPFEPDHPATQMHVDAANPKLTAGYVQTLQMIADRANAYGAAIVTYLQANAKAVITPTISCGRVPDPCSADEPIKGPADEVELAIR